MNLEQLGYLGVFLAGAIPWFEAIGVVPAGIIIGLDPVLTVVAAAAGNIATIAAFAYSGSKIRSWLLARREAKGKPPRSDRWEKAERGFQKYGLYGVAALGPLVIGTQFGAAVAVAAGVKPAKATLLISISMILWAVVFAIGTAWLLEVGGFDTWLGHND
jgi:hypothetical protein